MVSFAGKRVNNNAVEEPAGDGGGGGRAGGAASVGEYASYTRDSVTNPDYAQHQYYSSPIDRFTTVDPKAFRYRSA